MRNPAYRDIEDELLGKAFGYLVKNGLENISLRELCKGTGIPIGSIYYWFDGKDELMIDATKYGLRKVTDAIFDYVFDSLANLKRFFDGCLDEIGKYQNELRFIYQMAASPVYGEKVRVRGIDLNSAYEKYTAQLAEALNAPFDKIHPLVYLFISAVLDYTIWGDYEKTRLQLDYIYEAFLSHMQQKAM